MERKKKRKGRVVVTAGHRWALDQSVNDSDVRWENVHHKQKRGDKDKERGENYEEQQQRIDQTKR